MNWNALIIIICFFLFNPQQVDAQDPLRFKDEIHQLLMNETVSGEEDIFLFVGSSSIRFWNSLEEDFEGYPVVNRGFGGSVMSDLLYYQDSLIFKYNPSKIFIYEGDNDIWMEKPVEIIMSQATRLVAEIRKRLPDCLIYFIAAKPSISRWEFKQEYKKLNGAFLAYSMTEADIYFVDVWKAMCDENGEVLQDIFLGDDLHMNAQVYAIWARVMRPYVTD